MWRFDWYVTPYVSPCQEARRLQTFATKAIIPKLSDATTQEQFDAVLAALEQLKETLVSEKRTFHFPASSGRHYCIEECYQDLEASLRNQWTLRPQPIPEPEPRSPLETPEQVVADLGELIQHRSDETVLGEVRSKPYDAAQ
jgi:hypothetical protein